MAKEQDHYAVLGVAPSATSAEIKRKYRALMREAHPDANRSPGATRLAARINAAYETLGDSDRRRAYDDRLDPRKTRDRKYAHWAEQPDWEDIVAENVPERRPPHVHDEEPLIEPGEIEVDMAELARSARVRRRIRVTNRCGCTLRGEVSTSEPWVWGPIGRFEVAPAATAEFDIEVVSRKVVFPGVSRVLFVANGWTGIVPVKISGYMAKPRRVPPPAATEMAYVRSRRARRVQRR